MPEAGEIAFRAEVQHFSNIIALLAIHFQERVDQVVGDSLE